MSAGVLTDLLIADGLVSPVIGDSADAIRCAPNCPGERFARDKAGTANPLIEKAVPGVPAVPGEKCKCMGGVRAKRAENGAGWAGAAGNDPARDEADWNLRQASESEGLDPVHVLALNDVDAGELVALPDVVLRTYARALVDTEARRAGHVPVGWTAVCECAGCGPVWLWPGPAHVLACPWCWNRVAGLPVPRAG